MKRDDGRPCSELDFQERTERLAKAMRTPGVLADLRVPVGQCVLCNEILPDTWLVIDWRSGRVQTTATARGSAEEAEAIKLKEAGAPDVWITGIRLCHCLDNAAIRDNAQRLNAERSRPKKQDELPLRGDTFDKKGGYG